MYSLAYLALATRGTGNACCLFRALRISLLPVSVCGRRLVGQPVFASCRWVIPFAPICHTVCAVREGVVRRVTVSRHAVERYVPGWGLAPARPAGPPTEGHGAAARRTESAPRQPAAPRHVPSGAPARTREERGRLARRVDVKRCAPRAVAARDGVLAVRAPAGPGRRRRPMARGRAWYTLSCRLDGAAAPSGRPASMARQGGGGKGRVCADGMVRNGVRCLEAARPCGAGRRGLEPPPPSTTRLCARDGVARSGRDGRRQLAAAPRRKRPRRGGGGRAATVAAAAAAGGDDGRHRRCGRPRLRAGPQRRRRLGTVGGGPAR